MSASGTLSSPVLHANGNGAGPWAAGQSGAAGPGGHLPNGAAYQQHSSPGQQSRSPRAATQRLSGLTPIPMPLGSALAQQLSIHLAAAAGKPQFEHKRKMSRSAPSSPLNRPYHGDLSPLSTITPMELGGSPTGTAKGSPTNSVNGANGAYAGPQLGALGLVPTGSMAQPHPQASLPPQAPAPPAIPQVPQMSAEARAQVRLSPDLQMRPLRYSPEVFLKNLSPLPSNPPAPLPAIPSPSNLIGVPAATAQRSHTIAVPQRGATMPAPRHAQYRSRSRSRSRVSSNSSDDTETEADSDSTFVPGRIRHQHSRSQPDLTALRSRLVEGWADGVMREQLSERRIATSSALASSNGNQITRRRSHGRKTPPMRPVPMSGLTSNGGPSSSAYSSSTNHAARNSPRHSPRLTAASIPILTPIRAPESSGSSDGSLSPFSVRSPMGGMTGSEDADDDLESADSLSSAGSLTFSPKHRNRHVARQRSLPGDKFSSRALGLTLEAQAASNSADEASRRSVDIKVESIEERLRRSSLLSFRLLAIVPALWGIAVLSHALVTGALWHGVWPWGVDFSREALERLIAGETVDDITLPIHRGDMILAIAWACLTAHFCFCLTTGLTHRWRNYYSLPSTVTRLVSLQCLCWPATYLTLLTLGPQRPLLAWVVIGVTTGCSRTVQMWVTSNVIIDSPDPGDVTPGPFAPRVSPPPRPQHVRGLRVFTYNRRWSWDLVARKVGWKIGLGLLVTCAWLFWRLENLPQGY